MSAVGHLFMVCLEFDGRFDVYRVFFSAFEKADIQLKIKAYNNELKKLHSENNQVNKKVSSSKTKEELEKQVSKLEKSEERRHKRRERILEENDISDSSRDALQDVENRLMEKFKSETEQGKKKKRRIVSSFKFPKRYVLYTSFYQSLLPTFKSYVLLFQSDKPLIHQVYHKLVSLVKEFFSYFICPDVLSKCKTSALLLKNLISKRTCYL